MSAPAARSSASDDPQAWWVLDSLQHGGHAHGDVLAFMSYLADEADAAVWQRDLGLRTTVGLDLGPQPRGLLRRLLGGR